MIEKIQFCIYFVIYWKYLSGSNSLKFSVAKVYLEHLDLTGTAHKPPRRFPWPQGEPSWLQGESPWLKSGFNGSEVSLPGSRVSLHGSRPFQIRMSLSRPQDDTP
jgi:hypothetical protein